MADNYLEKKMEDYRRGVNSVSPRRSHNPASKADGLFPGQLRLALVINDIGLLEKLLCEFQHHGNLKTAFTCNDPKAGSKLAQSTNSLFVPYRRGNECENHVVDIMSQRWGGADVIVTDNDDFAKSHPEIRVIKLCQGSPEPGVANPDNMTKVYCADHNADLSALARLMPLLLASPASIIAAVTVK